MNIIRKMKYKVGQKFMIEMREGYHLSKVVRKEIEICRIDECTGLIWIKFHQKNGGLEYDTRKSYENCKCFF